MRHFASFFTTAPRVHFPHDPVEIGVQLASLQFVDALDLCFTFFSIFFCFRFQDEHFLLALLDLRFLLTLEQLVVALRDVQVLALLLEHFVVLPKLVALAIEFFQSLCPALFPEYRPTHRAEDCGRHERQRFCRKHPGTIQQKHDDRGNHQTARNGQVKHHESSFLLIRFGAAPFDQHDELVHRPAAQPEEYAGNEDSQPRR